MKSYTAQIADILARELLHKSRKKFATLNADAIEEIKMSTEFSKTSTVTSSMNANDPELYAAASPARLAPAVSTDSINSGMSVGSQLPVPVAKPVGSKNLEGSNAGDHRAPNTGAGVTDAFKNQSGPRGETETGA